ncbi:hypothetical protein ABZ203_24470 [Streptomyces albidoflavus]|uniref:hypothetical protein n=1 Tax=Streptomyces albidoflavus TaxID=1886 RepID=UPI0033A46EAD
MVNGQTVTGRLISSKEWFDLQAETLKASVQTDEAEPRLHTLFEGWAETTREYNEELEQVQEALDGVELPNQYMKAVVEAENPVGFIHLQGARVVYSNGFVPTEGVPWRGRMEHVSGWNLGELGTSRR